MKIFDIIDLALKNGGEYVLGAADLHTHACYLIYGVLRLREKGRVISPGKGHEEIICLIQGEVLLHGDDKPVSLRPGQSFYLKGEEKYLMDNEGKSDAVYVISGGHSEAHSHNH
jgi:glyoxylate utilization-related uncharacterized protein